MSRRRTLLVAVGIVVVVVAGAALAVSRLGGSTPTAALGAPHFVEEAAAAGIDHTYGGDFVWATGGGVAAFDCNGDGKQDLYFAGGGRAGDALPERQPRRRCPEVHAPFPTPSPT